VEELLADHPPPTPRDINNAFWQACAGGQRRVADYLLAKGADIDWVPDYTKITPLDAAGSLDTRRDTFVTWLREQGAKSAKS
jgi:ankyrin repeat protein